MARGGIQEYTEAIRGRYLRASKKEKGRILDKFTKVVGCHRKAAIRLLHRTNQGRVNRKRGCPRQYDAPTADALDKQNFPQYYRTIRLTMVYLNDE